jgi:hypothetical protein
LATVGFYFWLVSLAVVFIVQVPWPVAFVWILLTLPGAVYIWKRAAGK